MRAVLAAILLASALAGCATTRITSDEAEPVSSSRVLDAKALVQAPGTGSVTVVRDSGSRGGGCDVRVYADGNPIADLRPGTEVRFYLPEGRHSIWADFVTGFCSRSESVMPGIQLDVKNGGDKVVRFGLTWTGKRIFKEMRY